MKLVVKYRLRTLKFVFISVFFSVCFLAGVVNAEATEYTSTNFKVLDPVMFSSGYSSSTNYKLTDTLFQINAGTSTATGFGVNAGFLYYPYVTTPVVLITAGNGQVSLSWSYAEGFLGWNPSNYSIGKATGTGGPYTFTSVGNVNSGSSSGLSNGTTYYFVVRAEDAFNYPIATSTEVWATPVAPPAPPPTPPAGGGGGGGIFNPSTRVILKGRAYPNAAITIFKDGSVAATPKADLNANFQEEMSVSGGIYTFSVYAIDSENRRSLTSSFTANAPSGLTTTISDIVIAPTIGADKSEVKVGNDIKFFGYSSPQSQVNVIINSETTIADKTNSDKLGYWFYDLDSEKLERGDHTTKSQTVTPDNLKSPFSESLAFRIGDKDILFGKMPSVPSPGAPACNKNGDINNDKRVNIVDFSIMLYFWNQRSPKNPCADINRDGVVNLFDFSIMLFWWTG
ncbi:MAG: dockerin type I repeat-containing protein [Candidatus Paceibacterota bacterium]